MFNQVQISLPDSGKKSDVVSLRGPKEDVDQCFKYLEKRHKDLVSSLLQLGGHRPDSTVKEMRFNLHGWGD